jgi:hypothetical protein
MPKNNKDKRGKIIWQYINKNAYVCTPIIRRPYVMVAVNICVPLANQNYYFVGYGFSKCNPLDYFNEEYGCALAKSRAMRDLLLSLLNSSNIDKIMEEILNHSEECLLE